MSRSFRQGSSRREPQARSSPLRLRPCGTRPCFLFRLCSWRARVGGSFFWLSWKTGNRQASRRDPCRITDLKGPLPTAFRALGAEVVGRARLLLKRQPAGSSTGSTHLAHPRQEITHGDPYYGAHGPPLAELFTILLGEFPQAVDLILLEHYGHPLKGLVVGMGGVGGVVFFIVRHLALPFSL